MIKEEKKSTQPVKSKRVPSKWCKESFDMVKVWDRWQIVIPKKIRQIHNIQSGDKLFVFDKGDGMIGISKVESMQQIIDFLQKQIDDVT